jgi:hypothetical protein
VTDSQSNPIPEVTLSANGVQTATTDSAGRYLFTELATGTYILTPTKESYRFAPVSRTVSLPPEATGQDFTGTLTTQEPVFFFLPLILK